MATLTELQRQGYELTEKEMLRQGMNMANTYRAGRDQVLDAVSKTYGKYLVDTSPTDYYTVLNQYNRLQSLNQEISGIYIKTSSAVGNQVKASQELAFTNNFYRQEYVTTIATNVIDSPLKFVPLNPAALKTSVYSDVVAWKTIRNKKLQKLMTNLIPSNGITLTSLLIDNRKKELIKLQRELKSALINGESYTKTAKRIKGVFNDSMSNTMRVVRTEGNRNLNGSAYWNSVEAQKQGVELERQWLATLDANTRQSHQSLDGQKANKDDLFTSDGATAQYPGQFGVASEDVNCRCSTIDVVDGVSPELRRARDPVTGKNDIIDYKNYDQWMKDRGMIKNSSGKWVKGTAQPKPVIKPPTDNISRNYNSNLAKGVGKEHYDTMHNMIDKTPNKELARVFSKYEDKINIGDAKYKGQAHYKPGRGTINIDLNREMTASKYNKKAQTVFHEAGHAIDYAIGKERGLFITGYSDVYKDGLFGKTIHREISDRIDDYGMKIKAGIKAHKTDYKWLVENNYLPQSYVDRWKKFGGKPPTVRYRKAYANWQLEKEVKNIPDDYRRSFSDILEGATKGDVQAGYGHGKSYWKDPSMVNKEAFAEMLSATFTNPVEIETFKKYIPESYKVFQEMIKEL
jgi:SPP1 gp7 family putative phage head morphogenesis protein